MQTQNDNPTISEIALREAKASVKREKFFNKYSDELDQVMTWLNDPIAHSYSNEEMARRLQMSYPKFMWMKTQAKKYGLKIPRTPRRSFSEHDAN